MKKPELLAPAGDLERCRTAIRYGADAVYIGGQHFSLRSRASNFTDDDIREACIFAKDHNARIHVTVNVIPHEEDFEGLKEYLVRLQDYGVTAVIVASTAIMKLAKQYAPKLEVHCSTQMSVTNSYAAKLLHEQFGIDRVVLARECSMDEVRKITKECPVETEAFIHGGMCVNYSGRCTLSNRMTLRDANRGGCAQSCRWQYELLENDRPVNSDLLFTAGSKDLCAAEWIYDLIDAGVSSFKIEGRMKSEYYIASVVSAYRHLIDEILAQGSPLNDERLAWHKKQILRGENRQTWTGFYDPDAVRDSIIYHPNSDADVNHDFLATVISYNEKKQSAIIQTRNPFDVNDAMEVLSPYCKIFRFAPSWILNQDGEYMEKSRAPMALLEIPVPARVHPEDIIRRAG